MILVMHVFCTYHEKHVIKRQIKVQTSKCDYQTIHAQTLSIIVSAGCRPIRGEDA